MNKITSGKVYHDFPPFVKPNSRILILGSFPSVKSREQGFYYMHAQNRFWPVLASIFKDDFLTRNTRKLESLLTTYRIALYDVIESCELRGSADSTIKNVIPTDIKSLIAGSEITQIFLNGRKAQELFIKYNPELISLATYLPSTSAANASFTLDKLSEIWSVIKS